jgi:hypothetical protein
MAGVADPDVIDLIGQDADGRYLAIMIEERPWGSDPAQPAQLREKFNSYYTYIALGGYYEYVPQAAGQQVTIQLQCGAAPDGEIANLLSDAQRRLAERGIGFELKVVDYL